MNEQNKALDLYSKALSIWGEDAQTTMLFEECGELMSAIGKIKRGRVGKEEVITELADVSIMVEQMALMLGYDEFLKEKQRKIERLEQRLNKSR